MRPTRPHMVLNAHTMEEAGRRPTIGGGIWLTRAHRMREDAHEMMVDEPTIGEPGFGDLPALPPTRTDRRDWTDRCQHQR